ncbi:MAG TPA: Uma2 family endonuclease [Myxococcales bacterium]|nr:Uma2 family endonuclease [Myxococcales bacterium]
MGAPEGRVRRQSGAKFAVAAGRGRKPDLSVYFPGHRPPATAPLIRTPPDIVVEVVTPTSEDARRDRVDKLRDYARFGVRYYWLVDPELRTFEVLEHGSDGRYVHATAEEAGVVSPLGCEGLAVDLSALWSEVDRLLDSSK